MTLTHDIRRWCQQGFTLVEILIVVIILGILAAVVIPQFTNASTDARKSSVVSQLQTIRSQVELYKLQHGDRWPTSDGTLSGTWSWALLTGKTDATGGAGGNLGPYMQADPVNSLNNQTAMGTALGAGNGWVLDTATGKIYATRAAPATQWYDEATNNEKSTTAPFTASGS